LNPSLMKAGALRSRRFLLFLVTVTAICVSLVSMNRAGALYILTGADDTAIVLDNTADVQDFSSRLVYVDTGTHGYEVTLTAGQTVTVNYEGATLTAVSQEETVSALLSRLHITPGPLDMIAVDLSGPGASLTIASDLTFYNTVQEPAPYNTERVPSSDLPQGEEKVTQQGENGSRTAVYEIVYSGGKEISRQMVKVSDSTAVDEIVEYGTAAECVDSSDALTKVSKNSDGSGILTFQSGATLKFSATKAMTATAYTAGYDGTDYCTATGTMVHVGVVAVDKRVIPLGTRLYIVTNDGKVTYGYAVAEDTGVSGNKVDLYYDTYDQCINFGRRSATVYVLS